MVKPNTGFCHLIHSAETKAAVKEAESGNLDLSEALEPSVSQELEDTGIMGGWRERDAEL